MTDEQARLMFLDGQEAPEKLIADATYLRELPEDTFKILCKELFDERDIGELLTSRDDVKSEIIDRVDHPEDEMRSILDLLLVIIINASERDMIESQIDQDLISVGLQEERAERLADRISESRRNVRQILLENSLVEPVPNLVDMNWTVDKIVSTSAVQGINTKRVIFEFLIDDGERAQEVKFQADEDSAQHLVSQLIKLRKELSVGIKDIE